MTHYTNTLGGMAGRIGMLAVPLLVAATGTATAHSGGSYGSGMMGGGGWGLFGGGMGLWGLLWMGLLLAIPLYIAYSLRDRASRENDGEPRSILRERYARGELTDEEFEQRRRQLEESA